MLGSSLALRQFFKWPSNTFRCILGLYQSIFPQTSDPIPISDKTEKYFENLYASLCENPFALFRGLWTIKNEKPISNISLDRLFTYVWGNLHSWP